MVDFVSRTSRSRSYIYFQLVRALICSKIFNAYLSRCYRKLLRAHACAVERLIWCVSVELYLAGRYLTVCLFSGLPQALSSIQMIIICVGTDVLPALSMVREKPEADLLLRKPRDRKKDRLADFKLIFHAYFFIGILESLTAMTGCVCSFPELLLLFLFSSAIPRTVPFTLGSSAMVFHFLLYG